MGFRVRAVARDRAGVPSALILGADTADTLTWQIHAMHLPAPVREFRFDRSRRWRFDCAWPDRLLACEVNGSEFSQGRHTRGLGMAKDFEKLNTALLQGWAVLLFTGAQVRRGYAIQILEQALGKDPR